MQHLLSQGCGVSLAHGELLPERGQLAWRAAGLPGGAPGLQRVQLLVQPLLQLSQHDFMNLPSMMAFKSYHCDPSRSMSARLHSGAARAVMYTLPVPSQIKYP